jgi:hypothetical protein
MYEWVKLENLRIAREKRVVVEFVKLSIEENHLPIWRLPDEVALTPSPAISDVHARLRLLLPGTGFLVIAKVVSVDFLFAKSEQC